MEGYKLLEDAPDHIKIQHADGSNFMVAKHGLSLPMLKHISGLPKVEHHDDGGASGEDDADDETSTTSADLEGTPPDTSLATGLGARPLVDAAGAIGSGVKGLLGSYNGVGGFTGAAPDVAVKDQPTDLASIRSAAYVPGKGAGNINLALQPAGDNGGQITSGVDPNMMRMNSFDSLYQDYQKKSLAAIGAQTGAANTYANAIDTSNQELNGRMAAAQKQRDTDLATNAAQHDRLTNDIATTKIDPNRVWHNMDTGQKVGTGIAMLLSGFGSGLTHQPNMAQGVIDKAIERDIEAQRADLGKKQTLLSENIRKYGNIQQAYAATAGDLYAVAKGQAAVAQAKLGAGQANAAGLQAIAGMSAQQLQWQQQLAMLGFKRNAMQGVEDTPANEATMTSMFPKQAVRVPGVGIKVANSPEDANNVKAAQQIALTLSPKLDEMKQLSDEAGALGSFPGSELNAKIAANRATILPLLMKYNDLTRTNEGAMELNEGMLPDAGSLRKDKFNAQFGALKESISNNLNAAYSTRLIAHDPALKAKTDRPAP